MITMRPPTGFPTKVTILKNNKSYTASADGTFNVNEEDVGYLGGLGFVHAVDIYGVWIPTVKGSSTAGTAVYSTQSGYYTQIGKLVIANFNLVLTSFGGSPSGGAQIGGLPVASGANVGVTSALLADLQNVTLEATYTQILAQIAQGASVAGLYEFKTAAASKALPVAQIGATAVLSGTLIYQSA